MCIVPSIRFVCACVLPKRDYNFTIRMMTRTYTSVVKRALARSVLVLLQADLGG